MHKIVNVINNAYRYKKNCFKVKKNSKTILFLKCLVKSNVIRYFKEIEYKKTKETLVIGYINPVNNFEIKLLSKSSRKVYLSKQSINNDINCFFILTNNLKKSYIGTLKKKGKISGELVAKIFI